MSVVIGLFENGKQVQAVELSDGNYWEYSWTGLDRSKEWTVQELNVPMEYDATVLFQKVDDSNYVFTVTNSRITPIDISAKKVWQDDENPERPLSVSVALFRDGVQLSDGVTLSSGNEWTTTWTGLNPKGEYTVKEINCPKEYTPSYTRDGNTFIVTNKLLPKAQADVVTGSDFPWYLYLTLAVVLLGGGGFGIWYVLKRRRSA
jgi:YD repeat-containing protein